MAVAVTGNRTARRGQRESWSPPAFCEQGSQEDASVIVINDDDPMQSLTEAVRQHQAGDVSTVGSQLDAELDRISALTEQLARQVSGPISGPIAAPAVPVGPPVKEPVRGTAREAWSAVVILAAFIVAGFAWTTGEIQSRERQVVSLKKVLQEKETALVSYQQQVQQLRQDLSQSQAKLKAAERKR